MKVALIAHKFYGSKEETIRQTTKRIEEAAQNGANLVVLQELHQGSYFCQDENVAVFDEACDFESDVAYWAEVAREFKVVLVTSLFERRSAGLYHNTAVVFDSDGKEAGKYRKMHIPDDPNFYEKFYFTPGDLGFEPIDTSVGRLGVLVCWDQWYPEAARLMALKGAQILIYPTAIGWFDGDEEDEKSRQLEAWVAVQRGHAVANGLPVVTVNRVGFENAPDAKSGIRFWGNSFVFGSQGEEFFRSNDCDEITSIVDIDLKRCEQVRRWWPFLRDRRIDAYEGLLKRFID
ncbi:carbon-nitrogen family hydrolase [Campylobacter hyointestinalis]|uniref:Carbon-nitrogen family hydrolase n=1 Tax=Campylobacter hyointestinalis subsp. hyointestinalis TaxID=91352 RepID=A0A0S4R8H1_CAMHY|nr:carbon-nitrogen hydrolase [Campylobacter hyointestinalis]ANE32810.1 N-carbamoylputrescine amidohydrolase [Campylobacter hyointestinalis subsp. hyointestinalis LMG 9260]PPB51526.1 carbon-nitrogen hydrolase [Campylobacter hyointestinalis subsp. hyointestinalis]PPB54030.1 carbon-nitrogen hydrolase [Campylobacter hyointestinalis subsp. hyointestinalis]PPB58803.1 carbon-nitrogen hydrolase [Campylobacter hyointestinalis subsp. hyointestinalis]PPB60362.1 carbon-nitrogen hydrolase [Campylobacter hy